MLPRWPSTSTTRWTWWSSTNRSSPRVRARAGGACVDSRVTSRRSGCSLTVSGTRMTPELPHRRQQISEYSVFAPKRLRFFNSHSTSNLHHEINSVMRLMSALCVTDDVLGCRGFFCFVLFFSSPTPGCVDSQVCKQTPGCVCASYYYKCAHVSDSLLMQERALGACTCDFTLGSRPLAQSGVVWAPAGS